MIIELISLDEEGEDVRVVDRVTCVPGQAFRYETGRAESIFKSRQGNLGGVDAAAESLKSWSNGYMRTRVALEQ